jgi:hypothetical protein
VRVLKPDGVEVAWDQVKERKCCSVSESNTVILRT